MQYKIGIPASLMYFTQYPAWHAFFTGLGMQVVTSGATTKKLLDQGVKEALADACLPVKVYIGHVLSLKDKVDYLFVPRIVCLNKRTIYCPKFLGMPDMVKYGLSCQLPVLDTWIDVRDRKTGLWPAYKSIGQFFKKPLRQIARAYWQARRAEKALTRLLTRGYFPPAALAHLTQGKPLPARPAAGNLTFAVLGYPYLVHDPFVSFDLLGKLNRLGVRVYTMENVPVKALQQQDSELDKTMFWTFSDLALKAAFYFFRQRRVDGIIHLTAFGCGPDSMVDKLMELTAHDYPQVPFMSLTIDEHSGEAGVMTRLEAFVDMVRRKKGA
ncbi:acyl-CoA dehydratase activase-related protein [Desulfurispora thermophila]|uniref:acyl-CoA dehydratase activase-related protein n=1 Tax=Desulfurispora thermophila TaxID=265470 RepID=UPI0003619417|nr:acyl-CoA dehydratase activase-related protein [Desulfurispora thermophila]